MDEAQPPGLVALVVEDDAVQAFLVREALSSSGFTDVRIVDTLAAANQMLIDWSPDLVILDLGLPDADGLQLLTMVGDGGLLDIPVLVVTGESDPERRVKALELGAHDLVTKPFNLLELGVRAKRTLRAHDNRQAAEVLARSLAEELAELSDELEYNLAVAVELLQASLAMRSPELGRRARRVAASVHQLAVAVHLDDVAEHLGQAAGCHEVGALTMTDDDVAALLVGDAAATARCAIAGELLFADRHPLAAAATRHAAPWATFERHVERLAAQLTAVAHTFHAAATPDGGQGYDPVAGMLALRMAPADALEPDLVAAFLEVCVSTRPPRD